MEDQEPAKRKQRLISSLIAITSAVGGAVIYGIIGNRADSLFVSVVDAVEPSFRENIWSWIITLVILIVAMSVIYLLLVRNRALKSSFATINSLIELDGSLFRHLANLTPSPDQEESMKRILTDLLHNTMIDFHGEVYRASLLLPDPTGEYLKVWTHYGVLQDSVDHIRFYIGKDKNRVAEQGVAGQVFLDGKLRIAHMRRLNNGTRVCDCKGFTQPSKQHIQAYKSFVCVPIIGVISHPARGHTTTCVGVVCFDSLDQKTFDKAGIQTWLSLYAERIVSALVIGKVLP